MSSYRFLNDPLNVRFRALTAECGWTPKEIAQRVGGIGTSVVSQYKLGRTRPSEVVLELFAAKIAEAKQERLAGVERGGAGIVRIPSPEVSSATRGETVIGLQPESSGEVKEVPLSAAAIEHARDWEALRKADPKSAESVSYLTKNSLPRKKRAKK